MTVPLNERNYGFEKDYSRMESTFYSIACLLELTSVNDDI